jgi:hypothetical protein
MVKKRHLKHNNKQNTSVTGRKKHFWQNAFGTSIYNTEKGQVGIWAETAIPNAPDTDGPLYFQIRIRPNILSLSKNFCEQINSHTEFMEWNPHIWSCF